MPNARADRPMTDEELEKDARSICEQVFSAWDGQLDVVVMLIPRGLTLEKVSTARTIVRSEDYRAVLRSQMDDIERQRSIKNSGKTRTN